MEVLKFENTNKGLYKVKYVDDDLVEITATYDERPRKDLLVLLARSKYLFMRVMKLNGYAPDISDRLVVTGVNVKNGRNHEEYEIMAELFTAGCMKTRKILSYPLRPAERMYNQLTGEIMRDVNVEDYPALMNDEDVQLMESLIVGVKGFILGERDEEQLELGCAGGDGDETT